MNRSEWQSNWKGTSSDSYLNSSNYLQISDNNGKYHEGWKWVYGKKIRVFNEPSIPYHCVKAVKTGIERMISDIGLDLKVNHYPQFNNHPSITMPVRNSIVNGHLDGDKLSRYFLGESHREGSPHADVYISNKPLVLGGENWGQSRFAEGTLIMSLTPGPNNPKDDRNRQGKDFIDFTEKISQHEAGHLVGYQTHHDMHDIDGYDEPDDCIMFWRASTDYLCDKCGDAIKSFWEDVEDKTQERFFKVRPRHI